MPFYLLLFRVEFHERRYIRRRNVVLGRHEGRRGGGVVVPWFLPVPVAGVQLSQLPTALVASSDAMVYLDGQGWAGAVTGQLSIYVRVVSAISNQ